MKTAWRFAPMGEAALHAEPEAAGDADQAWADRVNRTVLAAARDLAARPLPGIRDARPAIRSLLVSFDPLVITRPEVQEALENVLATTAPASAAPGRIVDIAVRFGGQDGPDLDEAARRLDLAPDRLVAELCRQAYRVMMIGFAQGFPYLGPLPPCLYLPRRATPRAAVPAGSVAIAAGMAGIYPAPLPGGWHLIGRTDEVLFDPGRDAGPALLQPGDGVRFVVAATPRGTGR